MRRRSPWLRALAAGLAVALAGAPAAAHNVAVVHPEITDVALQLVRTEDMVNNGETPGVPFNPAQTCDPCSYHELWRYSGALMAPAMNIANIENETAYLNAFNSTDPDINHTVMVGAVVEDGHGGLSSARVVNHFYHAVTGVGLLDSYNSSQVRAEQLFLFGLGLHGYDHDARRRSYLYLGRALHHVEDMSSPAHVHNDAHLYLDAIGYDSDMDDYEGRYVPGHIWVNGNLRGMITPTAPVTVTTANQVWPVPQGPGSNPPENSLAGYVFNRTTYFATLFYPQNGTPPPAAVGELADMFQGNPADPDDGLHWVSPMIGFDRWVIDGVGEYHYKASWASEDDWWPDAAANERAMGDPDGVQAQYYIEQLMSGDTANTALEPQGMRQNYLQPWHPTGNPVVPNTVCVGGTNAGTPCWDPSNCNSNVCAGTRLVDLQAGALLTPPAAYVAGMAKWWFDIANLPPFVIGVEARQDPSDEVKYTATWDDQTQTVTETLVEAGIIPNTDEVVDVVTGRLFNHVTLDRKHINALNPLTLEIRFSEPIRDVTRLELLESGGAVAADLLALIATQSAPNDEAVKTLDPTDMTTETWTYTIEAANLMGLNGELTLRIDATDKNNHWQGIGGELDETPQTPALRNLAGGIRNPDFPWYDQGTGPANAYDFGNGDRNHRLLFDTEPPEATITVTP